MAASFVLFGVFKLACFGDIICTMMSSKRRHILPISILYTAMLSKQGYTYNVADSSYSGLKILRSMLFALENCQSNTVLLEYH